MLKNYIFCLQLIFFAIFMYAKTILMKTITFFTCLVAIFGSVYGMQNNNSGEITADLYRVTNTDEILVDGIRVQFNEIYSNQVTNEDAGKMWNPDESVAILNQNYYLSIDKRNLYTPNTEVKFYFYNYVATNYKLEINHDLNDQIYLYDSLANTYSTLTSGTNAIYYSVENNQVSASPERFKIVFTNPFDSTLSTTKITSKDVKVYPNPTKDGFVNIDTHLLKGLDVELLVYDQLGRQVFQEKRNIQNNSSMLNLNTSVKQGTYILQIKTDQQQFTKRLVVL